MSTKLFDAWRMPTMTMPKFQKWLDELRASLKPIADNQIMTVVAERAIRAYDTKYVFPNSAEIKDLPNGLVGAWSNVMSEYKKTKKEGERHPSVDVECEIIFHFKGRYIYMVMFSEQREYKDHLESLPGVEHYGYWNNTDKPDNISQREWRRREKLWDEAFKGGPMFTAGVTFMLVGDYNLPMPKKGDIEPYFTEWKQRVNAMLDSCMLQKYPEPITVGNIFKAYEWMRKDPEALKIREEVRPDVEKMMKRDLEFDDLNT